MPSDVTTLGDDLRKLADLFKDPEAIQRSTRSFFRGALNTIAHAADRDAQRLRELEADNAKLRAGRRKGLAKAWECGQLAGSASDQMMYDLDAIETELEAGE